MELRSLNFEFPNFFTLTHHSLLSLLLADLRQPTSLSVKLLSPPPGHFGGIGDNQPEEAPVVAE
jgi:hypothetical protein